ncbi:TPA: hypothetical protein ACRZ4F_001611 [Vibrio harveyi]
MLKASVLLPIVTILAGCTANSAYDFCTFGNVDTQLRSYADQHGYHKILVSGSPEFSESACQAFSKKGVSCQTYEEVFSPLKTYTSEQVHKILVAMGFDSALVLESGNSSSSKSYGGSINNFNVMANGNTLSGFGTSVPIVMTNGSMDARVSIYDIRTNEKLYVTDASTTGSGSACVNSTIFLRSMAETIVDDVLKKS